jgi:hypothetical protein
MATPRKRWFKVADAILREPWDDWTLATVVRLMAWLNQSRARDGKSADESGEALIMDTDAMKITGLKRPGVALKRLASLPLEAGLSTASASLETSKGLTRVRFLWAKYSEFQAVTSRTPDAKHPESGPPTPTPTPAPDERREEPPKPPSQGGDALELEAPRRRTRKRREAKPETDPPEAYTAEELAKLRAWCERTADVRGQAGRVASLAEACLIHNRKKGLQSCDWYSSAQSWIRNDVRFNPQPPAPPVVVPMTAEERLDRYSRVPPEPVRSYR